MFPLKKAIHIPCFYGLSIKLIILITKSSNYQYIFHFLNFIILACTPPLLHKLEHSYSRLLQHSDYDDIVIFYAWYDDYSHSYPNIISNDNFRHSHSLLSHWNIGSFNIMRKSEIAHIWFPHYN